MAVTSDVRPPPRARDDSDYEGNAREGAGLFSCQDDEKQVHLYTARGDATLSISLPLQTSRREQDLCSY